MDKKEQRLTEAKARFDKAQKDYEEILEQKKKLASKRETVMQEFNLLNEQRGQQVARQAVPVQTTDIIVEVARVATTVRFEGLSKTGSLS